MGLKKAFKKAVSVVAAPIAKVASKNPVTGALLNTSPAGKMFRKFSPLGRAVNAQMQGGGGQAPGQADAQESMPQGRGISFARQQQMELYERAKARRMERDARRSAAVKTAAPTAAPAAPTSVAPTQMANGGYVTGNRVSKSYGKGKK